MTRSYGLVTHPRSGDVYAAEWEHGRIVRAAGPVRFGALPVGGLHAYIEEANDADARADAEWLEGEL